MKIEVDRSELIKAMTASLKAVGGKTCMPILSDLLFEAGGGTVEFEQGSIITGVTGEC